MTKIEETWIRERGKRIKDPWTRGNQLQYIAILVEDTRTIRKGDSNRDSENI